MIKIDIKGYSEAVSVLTQFPVEMQRKMILPALRKVNQPIVKTARSLAPKQTGALAASIKVIKSRYPLTKGGVTTALKHVFSKTRNGKENQYYGRFVHDGTEDRVPKKKGGMLVFYPFYGDGKVFAKYSRGIKPRKYLLQAYNVHYSNIAAQFGETLRKSIENFVSKKFKHIT